MSREFVVAPRAGEEPEHPPLESTEDELSAYAGLYTYLTGDLELYLRDGTLWIQDIPKRGLPGQDRHQPGRIHVADVE